MTGARVQVQERAGPVRCALCLSDAIGEVVTCGGCGATHHTDCLRELGGACGTIGCPTVDPRARAAQPIPVAPLRCCPDERPESGAPGVVLCGRCAARFHRRCVDARRLACCGPLAYEPRPFVPLPAVGAPRVCVGCGAGYTVRERDRLSPRCEGCARGHWRRQLLGVALVCLFAALFLGPILLAPLLAKLRLG